MHMICQRILKVSLLWLHWLHVVECKTVVVKCSSRNYAYTVCSIPELDDNSRVMDVTKKKQLSSSGCTKAVSFGYSETNMWVSSGCRAEFYVKLGIVQTSSTTQDSTNVASSNVVMSTVLETSTAEQPSSSLGLELFSSYSKAPSSSTWSMSSLETPSLQHRLTPSQAHVASPLTLDVSSPYDALATTYNLSAAGSLLEWSSSAVFLSQTASVAPPWSASLSGVYTATSLYPTPTVSSPTPLNKVDPTDCVVPARTTRTCYCRKRAQTESEVARSDYIKRIVEKLQVNVETLSKTVREKTSAKDDRPSSVSMGYVGIVFLVFTALLIVLPDLCTVCNINNA